VMFKFISRALETVKNRPLGTQAAPVCEGGVSARERSRGGRESVTVASTLGRVLDAPLLPDSGPLHCFTDWIDGQYDLLAARRCCYVRVYDSSMATTTAEVVQQ
jgi:hypothetical protein